MRQLCLDWNSFTRYLTLMDTGINKNKIIFYLLLWHGCRLEILALIEVLSKMFLFICGKNILMFRRVFCNCAKENLKNKVIFSW
jgi:hypothetical protein